MVLYSIILINKLFILHNLVMNFQSLGSWLPKGPQKLGIGIYNNCHLFLFQWKFKVIYSSMQ
jgi:hypothetical protein